MRASGCARPGRRAALRRRCYAVAAPRRSTPADLRRPALAAAWALLLISLHVVTAAQAPSAVGKSALDPAFRLPAGGRALAGPLVDSRSSPSAAWLLSEDLALYALTDEGRLSARIDLASSRPASFLALDPFGRPLVLLGGTERKAELAACTRMGQIAWRAALEEPAGAASFFSPAFGSDGRAFIVSGQSLLCLSPTGLRLWSLPLPIPASCPPGLDGRGYPCVGLVDGSVLTATPYGELESKVSLGSPTLALCALPAAGVGTVPGAAAATASAGTVPGAATAATSAGTVPSLAAGLADGRVLLIAGNGLIVGSYRAKAPTAVFAWDGSTLYGLDASGEAFAIAVTGTVPGAASTVVSAGTVPTSIAPLWSTPTLCAKGGLYLFRERLVAVGKGRAVSLSLGGEVFRELSVPGGVGMPAISPAGLAYSSGTDWVLAAYRFERELGEPLSPALPPYPPLPDATSRELLFDPLAADPDRQLARLTDIHNSLRSGTIGAGEPAAAAYCAAVIERSLERERSSEERRFGGSPSARSRACELLGELGSVAYREPLFAAIEEDPDPAVRASACQALAEFPVDPDGRSMSAFQAAAARPVDEMTALVIVGAIEGMALRSGRVPSGDALRVLVKLTNLPYGQAVRSRALAAIGRISGASR